MNYESNRYAALLNIFIFIFIFIEIIFIENLSQIKMKVELFSDAIW